MKLDFKKLFLLFLPLFFLLPISARAEEENIDGATLYRYQAETTDGTSFLKATNGIIYPQGATKIDKIYLFFHGVNPPACTGNDCQFIDPAAVCKEFKLCEKVMAVKSLPPQTLGDITNPKKNIAILIPQMDPKSGDDANSFTLPTFSLYLQEALAKLHAKIPDSPNYVSTLVAHGKGAGILAQYIKYFRYDEALIFDGCDNTWCNNIILSGVSTPRRIYIATKGSFNDLTQFLYQHKAIMSGGNVKLYHVNKLDHYQTAEACFMDHIIHQGCVVSASKPAETETPTKLDIILAEINAKSPLLEINFPGLHFSSSTITSDDSGNSYVIIPWIAEFIAALYKFGVGITSIVAVVIIIIQGVRIIVSGGGENKTEGYKKITHALIGLVIAWGSFAILYNINPNLVEFNALRVQVIKPEELPEVALMQTVSGETSVPDDGQTNVGSYTSKFSNCPITLQNSYTPDKNSARTKEFYEKIGSVITGSTIAERALQIGDAAIACNVTFGSCGRTAGNIYNLAGLFSNQYPDKNCLLTSHGCEPQGSKESHHIPYATIKSGILSKGLSVLEIHNTLASDPTLQQEGWPDAWANQLQPGDGLWVYNGNSSGGNHTAIFVGWVAGGKAQVTQGSAGTPVHRGYTLCIKSECGDKMLPIIKTYKIN